MTSYITDVVARMLGKVEQFNLDICALPIPTSPEIIKGPRLEWANAALQEELAEFNSACSTNDVVEAADALIDLIYFALGRLIEMGIPANAVMEEVHRANMDKVQGSLAKREGSKGHDAIKPEGWVPPNHEWLMSFNLDDLVEFKKTKTQMTQCEAISPVWARLHQLREAKGKDYNNVPGGRDAYFPFGHVSYAHMIHTKELRLQSLIKSMQMGQTVNFEGILDTVEDLINYATYYAEAMHNGKLSTSNVMYNRN